MRSRTMTTPSGSIWGFGVADTVGKKGYKNARRRNDNMKPTMSSNEKKGDTRNERGELNHSSAFLGSKREETKIG